MLKQPYKCELCGVSSTVLIGEETGIFKAVGIMREDHDALSPNCSFHVRNITVYQPTTTTQADDGGKEVSDDNR